MEITRVVPGLEKPMTFTLTPEEIEAAYRVAEENYEIKDIKGLIEEMEGDELFGFDPNEIIENEDLIIQIHQRFSENKDCNLPYWTPMEEAITYVLEANQ